MEKINKLAMLLTRNIRKFLNKIKLLKNRKNSLFSNEEHKYPFSLNNGFTGYRIDYKDTENVNRDTEMKLDDLEKSNYSDRVIDLVKIIQIYIYDKNNPINKFNYLLRLFNRWRTETFIKQINTSEGNLNISKEKNYLSNLNFNTNIFYSVDLYSKYVNIYTEKIEKFCSSIIKIALKNILNYIKDIKNEEKNPNKLQNNNTTNSNSKNFEVFSFNINLSTANTNLEGNTNFQLSKSLICPKSKDESFNRINKSYTLESDKENRSLINLSYNYNNKLNNKSTLNKHVTFVDMSISENEDDEIEEMKISCAIDIQNFWREHLIQQYIKSYVKKLNFVEKITRNISSKFTGKVLFYFLEWRKFLKHERLLKNVLLIQKNFRKKLDKL